MSTMRCLVQKYGGTSVAGIDRLRRAAAALAASHAVRPTVAVVSAQGDTTDRLLAAAAEAGSGDHTRETDQLLVTGEIASAALLALCLRKLGVDAVSCTGGQAGITVRGPAGEGRVAAIDTAAVRGHLAAGRLVVVAGFHGIGGDGDVLTLGRGGSDTTAIALAAALGAERCEIFTDVAGVHTADPRLVPQARLLAAVPVDVMTEMAFAGARVLHDRAVELAAAQDLTVIVKSAFEEGEGTVISSRQDAAALEDHGIMGIAHDLDVTRVLIHGPGGGEDAAAAVLEVFARHNAPVDLVARSGPHEAEFRMGFTTRDSDLRRLEPDLRAGVARSGHRIEFDGGVAKVSLIGIGLLNRPQHTARLLSLLGAAGIPVGWLSTSQLRVSVTVPRGQVRDALALLHREFGLDQEPADVPDGQPLSLIGG